VVTDPYSFSLAMNSTRSQIVDLGDPALKPAGWDSLAKPALAAPEDQHLRDPRARLQRQRSVGARRPEGHLQGLSRCRTATACNHLQALQEAGLTHLHLLPVFDIATINENKAEWQSPDPAVLASIRPIPTSSRRP
jgi:pullulanase